MDGGVTVVTNPTVNVRLTSTISSFEVQRRFNKGISIAELKEKLEMVLGATPSCMELELFSVSDKFLQEMNDNEALLGSYPVDDDCRIHVIDRSGGQMGEFTDVSKVEKFEISADVYEKRTDSARSFMKKHCLGHFNEEEMAKKKADLAAREEEERAAVETISIGSRCKVQVPGQPTKLATVMYVGANGNSEFGIMTKRSKVRLGVPCVKNYVMFIAGTTDFKPGQWVGVKYDEPLGKHNGVVEGKQYFKCDNKYGGFVKPLSVTVGDFPEEDYDLDEI